jgi:hypothetical protein
VLFVIDGGTGLRKALRETCGPTAVVQRCQVGPLKKRVFAGTGDGGAIVADSPLPELGEPQARR